MAIEKENTIFYHEDYYKQIELIPENNFFSIHKELNNIQPANNSVNGYFQIIERNEATIRTESLALRIDPIAEELAPITLRFFERVTTGYGTSVSVKKNTIAFGFERIALFFEQLDSGIVKNIWLTQSTLLHKQSSCNNLFQALTILSNYNLILVDWNEELVIRLSNPNAIRAYLQNAFLFNFPSGV